MLTRLTIAVILFIILTCQNRAFSQQLSQTLYGIVSSKSSRLPLQNATIILLNSNPSLTSISLQDGSFALKNVPTGRQSLLITYSGYKELLVENILVTSGKQVYLEIELGEQIKSLDEIVVNSKPDKNKPRNAMTVAGGRMFSTEETQRFAAAFTDPARMATSFPGVIQVNDVNNDIVIRGNSPNGLLWRLNGVDIPNPNHFSSVGTSGGGISALSAQVLGNSDFLNGAFHAEYGNALSGIFDLQLRKGNNQKREYTLQAGFIGADFSAEGPFKKKYKGSYLVNYRYSALKLIKLLGVDIDDNSKFQDLSFHINLPTTGSGTFSIFGLGGISSQNEDKTLFDITTGSGFIRFRNLSSSNTGVAGLSHFKIISKRINIKSTLAATGNRIALSTENSSGSNVSNLVLKEKNKYSENKFLFSCLVSIRTGKMGNVLKTGFTSSLLSYSLLEGKAAIGSASLVRTIDESGSTTLFSSFAEYLAIIDKKISLNSGVRFTFLGLNKTTAVEPRLALSYTASAKISFSMAYGLHSQLQPTGVYFLQIKNQNGFIEMPNRNLEFSRAHHLTASWSFIIDRYHKIKTEAYCQYLFNIPVSPDIQSKTSILNETQGYLAEPLINKGFGRNKGIELLAERFLKDNFYYIMAASFYESKYKALDGIWRNTRFNGNYSFSLTAGNEFTVKKSKSFLGINLKAVYTGGFRTTPINLEASKLSGKAVYYDNLMFQNKLPDYNRLDFRISYRNNFKKLSLITSVDIQNITGRENVEKEFYNPVTKQIAYSRQNGLIPVLSIKTEF